MPSPLQLIEHDLELCNAEARRIPTKGGILEPIDNGGSLEFCVCSGVRSRKRGKWKRAKSDGNFPITSQKFPPTLEGAMVGYVLRCDVSINQFMIGCRA